MLRNRVITASVLIPIVIAFIFLADLNWFALLFSVIAVIGAWEWAGLCNLNKGFKFLYSMFVFLILIWTYWLDYISLYQGLIFIGAVYWLVAIVFVVSYQKQNNLLPNSTLILMLVGLFLLIPMWSSLVLLKSFSTSGASLIMCLMLLIWGADTAAYFSGKKWGKRKLANRVSPGKTWEGTIGGILFSAVIAICYVVFFNQKVSDSFLFLGLAMITVVASIFGDLMESLVKREAGQKDSGNILPGHGGVMDRIDSLTAASPVFVTGVIYLGLIG